MAVSDDIRKEKEKAKDMSLKGKLSYFWYYYKFHTLALIVAAWFLIILIRDVSSSKDYAFYAVYFNAEQTFSAAEQMNAFAAYADLDTDKYNVYLDNELYYSSAVSETALAASQKFAALIYSGDIDVVIADETVFTDYALTETFFDLRQVLPEDLLEKYKEQLFYVDGAVMELYRSGEAYLASGDYDAYDDFTAASLKNTSDPSAMENPIPVGIYVADTPVISAAGCYQEEFVPVYGIAQNTSRLDTAIDYLRFLGENDSMDFLSEQLPQ